MKALSCEHPMMVIDVAMGWDVQLLSLIYSELIRTDP